MLKDIINNPMYLIFLLVVLLVVVGIIWLAASSGLDIGKLIIGYFNTLFR